jgi:hypothetical protein
LTTRSSAPFDQQANPDGLGHQLTQEFQLLGHRLLSKEIDPGRIATRPGEARNQTDIDRVLDDAEDDRDVRCCGFGCDCRRGAAGGCDYRHRPADEVGY